MPTLFKADDIDKKRQQNKISIINNAANDSDNDEVKYTDELVQEDLSNDIDFPNPRLAKPPKEDRSANENKDNKQKLNNAVKTAQRMLFQTKTIFPFDLFPDQIIIDENKVDIISGLFFFSKEIYSIPISNISGVNSSFDLFFGQLRIEAWGLNKVPQPIKFLTKSDAMEARRIISGLILTNKQEINLHNIPLEETRHKLEVIGSV